ncbi:MAG: CBS domain-containing protein [Candidatus Tectomicrobia bacterium]|nr:CBS domain-containing protein [Candidatus Tectomicrobia bacterium]
MRQQQAEQTPISEVMHPHPHCVTEQQWVRDLVSLFLDEGISAAPVVDDSGKPIGFVSKTDVVREIKEGDTAKRPEIDTPIQPWWDVDRLSQLKVGEIMTPTLYTFSHTTTVADATAAMAFEGMHHLPVVDDSGKLVGMLSALDVLDWIARHAGYQPADGKHGQVFERPTR